jgi:streptomycin 6-kinase
VQIPKSLRATVERVHSEAGRQWLASVSTIVRECLTRWSLELDQPFENLSYNLVLPGRLPDGKEIVLKLGVPCAELSMEAAALSLFQGVGAVRLLDHDAARGILLMERVIPGTPIYKLQDDAEATRTAARLMRRLWRMPPANHAFPSLAVWFRAFARLRQKYNDGSGPFPAELIAKAESTFTELNASAATDVILHGDLHHENILSSAKGEWLAIDPKGISGDPGYEVGSFMLNQLPMKAADEKTSEILDQRLAIFSDELQISRDRLARWSFCHAVLSAVWDFEEGADWYGTASLALILDRLG